MATDNGQARTDRARKDLRFLTQESVEPRAAGDVPPWFIAAIGTTPERLSTKVAGARITYRAWGEHGNQLVVLIHGGSAHSGWWDHIAPLLAAGHRVVALDLSGHGDSDWRQSYGFEVWAAEVIAVAELERGRRNDTVYIGHSMGGCVSLHAAHLQESSVRAIAVIDSLIEVPTSEVASWIDARVPSSAHREYRDRSDAVGRFRAIPEDASNLSYVNAHVAAESLTPTTNGWSWKFDPDVLYDARMEPDQVLPLECDVALISGERGLATSAIVQDVSKRIGARVVHTEIPDAGHHILLEQPVALISVLRTLLATWT